MLIVGDDDCRRCWAQGSQVLPKNCCVYARLQLARFLRPHAINNNKASCPQSVVVLEANLSKRTSHLPARGTEHTASEHCCNLLNCKQSYQSKLNTKKLVLKAYHETGATPYIPGLHCTRRFLDHDDIPGPQSTITLINFINSKVLNMQRKRCQRATHLILDTLRVI